MGLEAVSDYIKLLDVFPNFVFIPERISEGDVGCCLTWRCEVNGEPGPSGISFNEVNADGKIRFARDIPAPSLRPPPFTTLAAKASPKLRVFNARPPLPSLSAAPPAVRPASIERLTSRPARAAIAFAWLAFSVYVAAFSPGEFSASADSFDNQLILKAIDDPTSLNPIFFAIFNALGVLPAVNLALLLPGSRDQKPLPTAPFIGASFALGFGAAGPYLALREPRPERLARSEVGFFTRYVTESRVYGAGLLAASLFLAGSLLAIPDGAAAVAEFSSLFGSSKLVHVSTIDFAILSAIAFEPIKEDMARRGWWEEGADDNNVARLLAFSAIPLVGPAAYLLLRPALAEDE